MRILNLLLIISSLIFVSCSSKDGSDIIEIKSTNHTIKFNKVKANIIDDTSNIKSANYGLSISSARSVKTNGIDSFNQRFSNPDLKDEYYNQALNLVESGERDKGINILQALVDNFPNFKQAKSLLDILESPFATSVIAVENHINNYLRSPSKIPKFDIEKPPLPKMPKKPTLTRGEFETTSAFQKRINQEKEKYIGKAKKLVKEYKRNVDIYNQTVKDYNDQILWEKKARLEKVKNMRKRYMDIAISETLGNPKLKDIRYNADIEQFVGKLVSSNNNLLLDVKVSVPISVAKDFKTNLSQVKPLVKIDILDNKVVFSKLDFAYNNETYQGSLLNKKSLMDFESKLSKNQNSSIIKYSDDKYIITNDIETIDFNLDDFKFEEIINSEDIDYNKEFLITE